MLYLYHRKIQRQRTHLRNYKLCELIKVCCYWTSSSLGVVEPPIGRVPITIAITFPLSTPERSLPLPIISYNVVPSLCLFIHHPKSVFSKSSPLFTFAPHVRAACFFAPTLIPHKSSPSHSLSPKNTKGTGGKSVCFRRLQIWNPIKLKLFACHYNYSHVYTRGWWCFLSKKLICVYGVWTAVFCLKRSLQRQHENNNILRDSMQVEMFPVHDSYWV